MQLTINIQDPNNSSVPGRAREVLAEVIGWDRVRELFPYHGM